MTSMGVGGHVRREDRLCLVAVLPVNRDVLLINFESCFSSIADQDGSAVRGSRPAIVQDRFDRRENQIEILRSLRSSHARSLL